MTRRWRLSAEHRAELALGAVAVGVLAFVAVMLVTVFVKAWPSFAHNGYIKWFFPGGDVDQQLTGDRQQSSRSRRTTSTTCARGRCCGTRS